MSAKFGSHNLAKLSMPPAEPVWLRRSAGDDCSSASRANYMATGTCMRPAARVPGSCRSGFVGLADSLQRLSISAPPPARMLSTPVQGEPTEVQGGPLGCVWQAFDLRVLPAARRECMLTGKTANNGYTVSFSHKRNKKLQGVNLQWKRIYWPEGQRWVRLRICTRVGAPTLRAFRPSMTSNVATALLTGPQAPHSAALPSHDVQRWRRRWSSPGIPQATIVCLRS